MKNSSFKLVNSITREEDPTCIIPVKKYISQNTGMNLYGPVVEGYFSLATEAFDDDGLPHTLEHMIFLGSEDYPYSGILDLLANKVYAAGTNAWTDVDNTTYTISTVEKSGFLQLLPIYLDHIFFPLLNESGFVTEVYHVNGEGEDAGVVYSEMQSVENEDENVVNRAFHRAIYPDEQCGYRYETGGVLKNLRTSCSHKKVCDYHKQLYRPDNMAIIVAGQIDDNELIDVLSNFEKKILSKNTLEKLRIQERPFTKHISKLKENIEQTVYFPVDEEKSANGLVAIGWRGPNISNIRQIIALDLLLYYLSDSSISPLQSHFINKMSYCNKISYRIEEYRESYLAFYFANAQVENVENIKKELFQLLNEIIEEKVEFDIKRMRSIIKTKISDIKDKLEDSPHETISQLCIGDFLYGSLENLDNFKQKFSQHQIFESLSIEVKSFWLKLADEFLRQSFSVTIIGKPCEKLMHSIGREDQQRVDERKKILGKKGLKELKVKVDNAIDQNDDFEVPNYVYNSLKVPSLEKVQSRNLQQFFSYDNTTRPSINAFKEGFNDLKSLKHLQLQIDHLEGTNFVQVYLMIDTNQIDISLRPYLQLFIASLFELPIKNSEVNYTHEQTVYELNKDLLEFDASIGLNGDIFEPGIFPQYLSLFTKAPVKDYEIAVKWMKMIFFDTVLDKKQIKIVASNLIKEIRKRKQQPFDLIESVIDDLYFEQDNNMTLNSFLRQEKHLNDILEELDKASDSNQLTNIERKLSELRNSLVRDQKLRFYMCADLNKLVASNHRKLDEIWLDLFPATFTHQENNNLIFVTNQPFKVDFTWKLKKNRKEDEKEPSPLKRQLLSSSRNDKIQPKIFTPACKKDFLINLGSTESSFVRIVSSIDIDSYEHPNYAALLVLIEYFTQTEGPLYEAVRGPGFAYHQSMSINPEKAKFQLSLDECSNLPKAYEATRKLFSEHLNNKSMFDGNLLEAAKNSLIFLLIDDLKSVSNMSAYSMSCHFKNVKLSSVQDLIKKVEKVEIKELRKLLKSYLMPLFDDETSNCIIVCHPAKSKSIIDEFHEKFDRKLNVIGKMEECLCMINSD